MHFAVAVRDPVIRGPVALYPLVVDAPPAPDYLTGAEATDVIVVDESGTVPELLVHNTGTLPVLLIEGEVLLGARQDRTLDTSVLLPTGTTTIPVSCVEEGRWDDAKPVQRTGRIAPLGVRTEKVRTLNQTGRVDQHAVWDAVDHQLRKTVSSTRRLEDVFDDFAERIAEHVVGARPEPDQRGVVVAAGGRVVALEVFDKPSTLTAHWDGLLAGYAIDASGYAIDASGDAIDASGDATPDVDDVRAFVAAVRDAQQHRSAGVGLGTDVRITGDGVTGSALVWDDTVVHLAAFAL